MTLYCGSLYTQWHLDVSDRQAPCCFYDVSRKKEFDLAQDRLDMQSGRWPKRCEYCRVNEALGARSPRLDYTQRVRDAGWPDSDDSQLFSLSLFIGNKCNLHCITCDAKYSTGWIKIAEEFDVDQSPHVGIDTMRLDTLLPRLKSLNELSIMGGEPMYQDDLLKVISYLSQHLDLSHCLLKVTTNGVTRPSAELLDAMSMFSGVDLTMSIDGVGDSYEYIRHPAKWNDLLDNIRYYKDMPNLIKTMRMNATISTANLWEVDRIAEWGVKNFGINFEFNMARKNQWEIHNLPAEIKFDWVKTFGDKPWNKPVHSRINQWGYDSVSWQSFRSFIRAWDQRWGLDFATTFPEYASVIKKHDLW